MIRRILFLAALFAASLLYAEPIDDSTFRAVMLIADQEGVPRSIAARLMFEESGDPKTGSRGNPKAFNKEPSGYQSQGLFQLHTGLDNMRRKHVIRCLREYCDISGAKLKTVIRSEGIYHFTPGVQISGAIVD